MSKHFGGRDLMKLAYCIFRLTREGTWTGGLWEASASHNPWPKGLEKPYNYMGNTWTLSPSIRLGGHTFRLCISRKIRLYHGSDVGETYVHVFCDDNLQYPGGTFVAKWWNRWVHRLERQSRLNKGWQGPVDTRDQILKEARRALKSGQSQPMLDDGTHKGPVCRLCQNALDEVDQIVGSEPAPGG